MNGLEAMRARLEAAIEIRRDGYPHGSGIYALCRECDSKASTLTKLEHSEDCHYAIIRKLLAVAEALYEYRKPRDAARTMQEQGRALREALGALAALEAEAK